jgi:multiple sugar transport system ATP-binding protein
VAWLEIDNLQKIFPRGAVALESVSLSVDKGEFFTIVGPTNAGKSTLLKLVGGVERADRGRIWLAGCDVTWLQPRHRKVSLLFQSIALFPNRTGFENLAFPMKVAGVSADVIQWRVHEVADILKISHVLDRLPRTFSGGEQQRVAIGRAIVHECDLLMLDEPLTNLDARIRVALRLEFKKMHRQTGQTLLYVTHDQVEAMSMSDRIGVLNRGRFEQIGTPDEIYRRPISEFVARFVGTPPMNILDCTILESDGQLKACGEGFEASIHGRPKIDGKRLSKAAIGIRPENITASFSREDNAQNRAQVLWVERLGPFHILDVQLGRQVLKIRTRADHPVNREGPIWCGLEVHAEHILDRTTGLFVKTIAGATFNREEAKCV